MLQGSRGHGFISPGLILRGYANSPKVHWILPIGGSKGSGEVAAAAIADAFRNQLNGQIRRREQMRSESQTHFHQEVDC